MIDTPEAMGPYHCPRYGMTSHDHKPSGTVHATFFDKRFGFLKNKQILFRLR